MTFDPLAFFEKTIPFLTAVAGGVGVKVIDKIMSKRSQEFNEAVRIRDELRQQIETLREELEHAKTDADEWRTRYWEQIEVNITQKGALESLKAEIEMLRRTMSQEDHLTD